MYELMTQIMNLLLLAPDIQEQLLFLSGTTAVPERRLRDLASLVDWRQQRKSSTLAR